MHRHEYIPIPISQKSNQKCMPYRGQGSNYYSSLQATSMSHIVNVKLTECDPQVHCISVAMAAITKYHKLGKLSSINVLTPCQVSGTPCSTCSFSRRIYSGLASPTRLEWQSNSIFIWSSPGMCVFLSTQHPFCKNIYTNMTLS